jgi:hypothetical protein
MRFDFRHRNLELLVQNLSCGLEEEWVLFDYSRLESESWPSHVPVYPLVLEGSLSLLVVIKSIDFADR